MTKRPHRVVPQPPPEARKYTLHHWRNHQDREYRGREIDLIIEAPDGAVVAVEIKASSSPSTDAVNHLRWLRDKLDASNPGTFRSGILLHTGPFTLSAGDRLHLRPLNCLWSR